MELGITMRFVMVRAQAEVVGTGSGGVYPEHIFLGILKLAESSAERDFSAVADKGDIDDDIRLVGKLLSDAGISPGSRPMLRRALKASPPSGDSRVAENELLTKASKSARNDQILASDVLTVLINDPPPIIKAIYFGENSFKEKGKEPGGDVSGQKPDKRGAADKLAGLVVQVMDLRVSLLEIVRGQDHAVHAFTEGIFNSEIMAGPDDSHARPKAVFLFAGPPGVGKTYLAEESAKLLSRPFKRFDMSSFSDHQAHSNLIGISPSYKAAKAGTLSGFVKKNPECILLFDEIEKAHLNTIQLFLQILDAGILHDDFTDEDVPFGDSVIIFTTNAGKRLYDESQSGAGLSRQTILEALETDIDPRTGNAFFPPALCSRIAAGYPVMFNHLQAHDLESIAAGELTRLSEMFREQYEVDVSTDPKLPSLLLFSEGGLADARTLRAQTELFFKNEIFKLSRLWEGQGFSDAFANLCKISFSAEPADSEEILELFTNPAKPGILFYGNTAFAEALRRNLDGYKIWDASDIEGALKIAGEQDILFVLAGLTVDYSGNADETRVGGDFGQPAGFGATIGYFDHVPIASSALRSINELFGEFYARLPEIPLYLLDFGDLTIDDDLMAAFTRRGVRGKIGWPDGNFHAFTEEVNRISDQLYLHNKATDLSAESKTLYFETAPKLSDDKKEAVIRLRDFALRRSVRGSDMSSILDEAEKPDVRFDDVIGAGAAKEELAFFVDFLKNTKKFSAQGLKPPKGVLLHGPPGTGKTLLAKAMAGESGAAYIPAVGSGFVTKYQGSGEEAVRELFMRARRYAPSIVFIDEIDAIGRTRGGGDSAHGEEMALNALLAEMDGFSSHPKRPVFVLAATNFDIEDSQGGIGTIDAALARRFDRKILVDLPDKDDRKRYLELKLRNASGVSGAMIERIAGRSAGLSLAHLETVLEFASRIAVKSGVALDDEILDEAFETSTHGEKKDWGHEYLERLARHESGHAWLCYLAGAAPAYLTITARGGHGGYMEHSDSSAKPVMTADEMLDHIRTLLGGRAAELVYYGDRDGLSNGASGDLKNATRIARAMVCEYGMDDKVGLAVLSPGEISKGPLAETVTSRVSDLLKESMDSAIIEIMAGRMKIDLLVERLLEKNKLVSEEIEAILNG